MNKKVIIGVLMATMFDLKAIDSRESKIGTNNNQYICNPDYWSNFALSG